MKFKTDHAIGCQVTKQHFVPDETLATLPTKRLLALLNKARAVASAILYHDGPRCCEFCHEYIGADWERDVGQFLRPWEAYVEKIKALLKDRPHVEKARKGNAKLGERLRRSGPVSRQRASAAR